MTMWETLGKVLTSDNGLAVMLFFLVVVGLAVFAVRYGLIKIRTRHVRIGSAQDDERAIIRQQIEWSHLFIQSLASKIETDTSQYNGYFTKYILERCYDEVVDWITFNHLNLESDYISIKQDKICALVYSLNVRDEFKTPEFKERMRKWTKEVIERLVQIRSVYRLQADNRRC